MEQAKKFVANANKHVGDARIVGEREGKVLWVDERDDEGIIVDSAGNEYYFNPASAQMGYVLRNQLVKFTAVQPHSFKPQMIALDVRDILA